MQVRDAEDRLRQEARQANPMRTRDIVAEVRSSIPVGVRVAVESGTPSSSAMVRAFNWHKVNARRLQGDEGLDLDDPRAIQIPAYLQEFGLIFNENIGGQKMLVIMSNFGEQMLRNANEVSIDGTFDKVPRGFNQLYTLAVIIDRCAIPAVFGILPAKSQAVYNAFFGSIRQAVPQFDPNIVISDFESSALTTFGAIFPRCIRAGCVWHFGEAISRNLRQQTNMRRIWDIGIEQCNANERDEKLRLK
ncbi:hypothetical protein niasHS_016848 [Heterodera schachtii]|uniref:MULE transposase domain-containing protein n=1 Tax=Heterodera schachtii TaxID=97005 RepID=A0ABD2HQF9_HETSC